MSQIVPVWMWLPDQIEPVLAGEFGWSKSGGEFSYDGSYIQNHRGMALDPIELPTRIGAFRATGPDRVFGDRQLNRFALNLCERCGVAPRRQSA